MMKDLNVTIVSTMATILVSALAVHGAAADSQPQPRQQIVRFADLNLAAPEGARTLYGRLRAAARQVCSAMDGRSLDDHQRYRACVAQAVTQAVVAINEPALTDVYLARAGSDRTASRVARAQ